MGLMQNDLKRIIAYSTCSQLGFMTMACGLGYYTYAFFHLTTHAFFKCLLFLCSGSIIHALNDEQDIRKMGNLFYFLPVTFGCMVIGTLALTGFPFLAGYYSKDLILETAFASASGGIAIYSIGTLAAFFTSFYSVRSLYLVFFRKISPLTKNNISNIHESPVLMLIPMITLAILSVVSGYILQPAFTGPLGIFGNSISSPLTSCLAEHEYIHISIKLLPTFLGLLGWVFGYIYFSSDRAFTLFLQNYLGVNLAYQKFYIDLIYNQFFARNTVNIGYLQYTNIDRGLLETLGPNGLGRLIIHLKQVDKLDTAFIPHYIILFAIIILIGLLLGFSKYITLAIIALCISLFI
jgi:NADH:ubiquinone oxidoreductase subunit 5 (subunit L)/multisubunit Na+/H+ antiporter MnhA subunit